jgi:Holliday junction DNA helicase RuvA
MITRMTGLLTRVLDDEVRLQMGALEYQVLIPEAVRRQIQMKTGQEITFHITEYLEGNSGGNRFIPRRIGFNTEAELEFFDLFCTVEKIGAKKALKAMARPVKEIADAIARQDTRWLSTLPGIGATTAEQIVTTLKRKIGKFTMMSAPAAAPADSPDEPKAAKASARKKGSAEPAAEDAPAVEAVTPGRIIEDVYLALMSMGLTPVEARNKIDLALQGGKSFTTFEEAIGQIYSRG